MTRTFFRSALAATAVLSLSLLAGITAAQDCPHCHRGQGQCNSGNCNYRDYASQDLFYNHYVGNNCGGMGAQLYLSPRPVPQFVGNTYITYQPLMPHEFLYQHQRTYHRYYNGGLGLTRTSVRYSAPLFGH
jgi:hypothetical protein